MNKKCLIENEELDIISQCTDNRYSLEIGKIGKMLVNN